MFPALELSPLYKVTATGTATAAVPTDRRNGSGMGDTHALLAAMLRAHDRVSDLIFSPGRLPQVEVHGQLITVEAEGFRALTADDTRHIAADLIGENKQAINILREQGSCDVSFGLAGLARFRVNVFIQRGSCAVVMRVIPTTVPELASLGLPPQLAEVAALHEGIVLVTGPRGSGKSSTLASLLDRINQERLCHIITIEDPIEFLHNHKRATVHQRELHSDTHSIALALKAAMRQAPNVILVSELHDRETVEMVLDAAETGHLVFSSLNTPDAGKTLERIVGYFSAAEHEVVRGRLAKTIRVVVSQRLIPRCDGRGRAAAVEVLKVRPGIFDGNSNGFLREILLQIMKNGAAEGMRDLDSEIEKLVRTKVVDPKVALGYATNPEQLRKALADFRL